MFLLGERLRQIAYIFVTPIAFNTSWTDLHVKLLGFILPAPFVLVVGFVVCGWLCRSGRQKASNVLAIGWSVDGQWSMAAAKAQVLHSSSYLGQPGRRSL